MRLCFSNLVRCSGLIFWLSAVLWFNPWSAVTAQMSYRFRSLGLDEGLSQTQVNAIVQDDQGFIWLGTKDGLNRYDGYDFTVFRNHKDDPFSLIDNMVLALHFSKDGRLWIGTNSGLVYFDQASSRFYKTVLPSLNGTQPSVNYIAPADGNSLWLTSISDGLFRYHMGTGASQHFHFGNTGSLGFPGDKVNVVMETCNGAVWLGADRGLFYREPGDTRWHRVASDISEVDLLSNGKITALSEDPSGKIWVGTEKGLNLLEPTNGKVVRYGIDHNLYLNFDPIWYILPEESELWIARDSGLYRMTHPPGVIPDATQLMKGVLTKQMVYTLHRDHNQLLWIGTGGFGAYIHNPYRPFLYLGKDRDGNGLTSSYTYAIEETRDGNLWVGNISGLDIWEPESQAITHKAISSPLALNVNTVWDIHQDRSGDIWVGSGGGLWKFGEKTWRKGPTNVFTNSAISAPEMVSSIYEQKDASVLWVGSLHGLYRVDSLLDNLERIKLEVSGSKELKDQVRCFAETKEQEGTVLWIGTEGAGLVRMTLEPRSFQHFRGEEQQTEGLSNNRVICLLPQEDTRRLWVGTRGGGLNMLNLDTHSFTSWRERDGLANDTVYGILPDDHGNLWLSTNQGISRFDVAKDQFTNYDANDGLQGTEFNTGASLRARDGMLYFGGTEGITAFYPSSIRAHHNPPRLAFTEFTLFNKPVETIHRNEHSPLEVPISRTQKLTLDHTQNVFSLTFTAFDFSNPSETAYAYRMEGFDQQWLPAASANRTTTYTNLDPGKYAFKVKAANQDGIWNECGITLQLDILPPPWRTPFAYGIYVLSVLALVLGYMVYQKRARKHLEALVQSRTLALQEQNKALNSGLQELETLFQMAQTINREQDLKSIINIIINQGLTIFPEANIAAYLSFVPHKKIYEYVAVTGLTEDEFRGKFIPETMASEYAEIVPHPHAKVFSVPKIPDHMRTRMLTKSYSMIVMPINVEDRQAGLLVLGNQFKTHAFDDVNLSQLVRFLEHLITALMRIQVVNNLQQTQRTLMEEAHRSGMAETATQVLHNLGNALNSLRTNAQLIQETASREVWLDRLVRIADGLEQVVHSLPGSEEEKNRGYLAVQALQTIRKNLGAQNNEVLNHCDAMGEVLGTITATLHNQQSNASARTIMREAINLNQIIEETLSMEFYAFRQENIHVKTCLEDVKTIQVERSKIRLILLCLLENAREAFGKSTKLEPSEILITTRMENNSVLLSLEDNGNGIPEAVIQKVCRQGFSTKNSLGLGLHFVANAMKEWGGRIRVASDGKGKGATVTLDFPIAQSQQSKPGPVMKTG